MFADWTDTNGFLDPKMSTRPLTGTQRERDELKKRLFRAGTPAEWSTGYLTTFLNWSSGARLVNGHAAPEYELNPSYNKIGIPFYFDNLRTYGTRTQVTSTLSGTPSNAARNAWQDIGDFVTRVADSENGVPKATVCAAGQNSIVVFSLDRTAQGTVVAIEKKSALSAMKSKLADDMLAGKTIFFVGEFGRYTTNAIEEDVDLGGEQFFVPEKLEEFKIDIEYVYSATNVIRLNEWAMARLDSDLGPARRNPALTPNQARAQAVMFQKHIEKMKDILAAMARNSTINANKIYVGSA